MACCVDTHESEMIVTALADHVCNLCCRVESPSPTQVVSALGTAPPAYASGRGHSDRGMRTGIAFVGSAPAGAPTHLSAATALTEARTRLQDWACLGPRAVGGSPFFQPHPNTSVRHKAAFTHPLTTSCARAPPPATQDRALRGQGRGPPHRQVRQLADGGQDAEGDRLHGGAHPHQARGSQGGGAPLQQVPRWACACTRLTACLLVGPGL